MILLLFLDQGTGVAVQVNRKGQRWTCPASSKQLETNKRERHTVWLATTSNCTDNAYSMKRRGKAVTLRRQWSIGSWWNLWGCRTTSVHPTGAPKNMGLQHWARKPTYWNPWGCRHVRLESVVSWTVEGNGEEPMSRGKRVFKWLVCVDMVHCPCHTL